MWDDVIVFVGLSYLCYGVWYVIARLDQWQGDRHLRKKDKQGN